MYERKANDYLSKVLADNILDIIHSDVCGPIETPSIGKAKYFLTFINIIDDHS